MLRSLLIGIHRFSLLRPSLLEGGNKLNINYMKNTNQKELVVSELSRETLRYLYWRREFVADHSIAGIKKKLEYFFDYEQIKHGDLKKGEGDIVIINLKSFPTPYILIPKEKSLKRKMQTIEQPVTLEEYITWTSLDIAKIETKGIYTNLYFGKKILREAVNEITKQGYPQ